MTSIGTSSQTISISFEFFQKVEAFALFIAAVSTILPKNASSIFGMYIDYQSLSRQFGKDRRVIKDYISYLQESFLISMLGNYRKGNAATLRKRKRAYPTDNAIIYLYKREIDDAFFGRMVESAAINKAKASTFWKNSNEIDMVCEDVPIEVKYQERIDKNDLKPVEEFMKRFGKKEGVIITKKDEH